MSDSKCGLIRKSAVLEALADRGIELSGFDECAEQTVREDMALIQRLPTVDAVEVVRCGECAHRINSKMPCAYKCVHRRSPCYGRITYADFGCLYGERRGHEK